MPSTEFRQAKRKTQEKLDDSYSPLLDPQPALLGDGRGTVEVAGLTSHVWVRLGDEEAPAKVLNQKVPNIDELAVFVGTDAIDGQYQVLAVRSIDYLLSGQDYYRTVPGHHESHEWESYANQGGYDTVWASFEQVTTLMVRAAPTLGAFWIQLHEGPMPRQSGWEWISAASGNTVTLNLAGDVPGAGARMALIYIDSAGDLQRRLGAIVALAALDITDTPAPLAGEFPVAAVRLYQGQTALSDNFTTQDITQLRYPQFGPAGDWIHDHSNNANGGNALAHLTHTPATAFVATHPDNLNPAATFVDAGGIEYLRYNTLNAQPELVVNDGGVDVDTRIEGVGRANALFVQGSDGFVGMGIAPTSVLHIYNATGLCRLAIEAGANQDTDVVFRGDRVWFIQNDGNASLGPADYLHIRDATGAESVIILDTSQQVGIGTVNPSTKLHVYDANAATNTPVEVARLEIESSGGAGAAGLGPALRFTAEDAGSNLNINVAQIAAVWENAAAGSRQGQFRFFANTLANLWTVGAIVAPATSVEPAAGAWGTGAVDWQTQRAAPADVASGSYATIGGGSAHEVSGDYSTIPGGLLLTITSDYAFLAGRAATVSHDGAALFSCNSTGAAGIASDHTNQWKATCDGAEFHQRNTTAARAVLTLDQDDQDEPFIHYDGHGATDCSLNISDLTPTFALVGYVRIQITDANAVVASGDYWMPFYSCTP